MTKLQIISRSTWIAVGVVLLASIIITAVQVNSTLADVRRVTGQLNADDIRRVMSIVETQQQLEMEK